MHYAISTTWGPTDTTRASLPFIFADTALNAGDTVTLMLFHDAVLVAVEGAYQQMVPCGPPPRFAEVFGHDNAEIIVCKPCAEVRGIDEESLLDSCRMGGMGDLHEQIQRSDCKPVTF